jgi:addiction module HigA family antidote
MMRMARPVHPGSFIRAEIVEAHGLTVPSAAQALGVAPADLSALLDMERGLSPEMALRIEKAFGVSMETLLRMQTAYEIAVARSREGEIEIRRYEPRT